MSLRHLCKPPFPLLPPVHFWLRPYGRAVYFVSFVVAKSAAHSAFCIVHSAFPYSQTNISHSTSRPARVAWNNRGTMPPRTSCVFRFSRPNIVPSICDLFSCAARRHHRHLPHLLAYPPSHHQTPDHP